MLNIGPKNLSFEKFISKIKIIAIRSLLCKKIRKCLWENCSFLPNPLFLINDAAALTKTHCQPTEPEVNRNRF